MACLYLEYQETIPHKATIMIVRSGNYPEEAFVSEAAAFPGRHLAPTKMRHLLNTNPQRIPADVTAGVHP
jgi:hypothetical protein